MIDQIVIASTGMTAVFLSQQSKEKWKKYASILGLLGQPFWFWATISAEQWGMFVLCIAYTYSWALGFYNNWIRKV